MEKSLSLPSRTFTKGKSKRAEELRGGREGSWMTMGKAGHAISASISLSLSLSLPLSPSFSLSLTLTLSLSHTHSLSLSLSLSHIHTHTQAKTILSVLSFEYIGNTFRS